MIPCFVGVRRKNGKTATSVAMQTWLEDNGLQSYLPHVFRYSESENLSAEWNSATGSLNWKADTIAYLARLSERDGLVHIWMYGGYFYGAYDATTWRTVTWPDPRTGLPVTQDAMPADLLASYLRRTYEALQGWKINGLAIFDEPPHPGDPDVGKYGWTEDVQKRVLKMGEALNTAHFPYAVCFPNYQSLRFWTGLGLAPDIWVLNEANDYATYAPYLPKGARVGVYNVRSAKGLASRLATYGNVELVLQWNAVPWVNNNTLPLLFKLDETAGTAKPTQAALQWVSELKKVTDQPAPLTLEKRLINLERRVAVLEKKT